MCLHPAEYTSREIFHVTFWHRGKRYSKVDNIESLSGTRSTCKALMNTSPVKVRPLSVVKTRRIVLASDKGTTLERDCFDVTSAALKEKFLNANSGLNWDQRPREEYRGSTGRASRDVDCREGDTRGAVRIDTRCWD